mmetsp:Transcript_33516/g.66011  ORF Transcript_33516/g.66011 Transcript_33516/m.66011 type:complete len:235 (-) Transcript_33516:251-955(-)
MFVENLVYKVCFAAENVFSATSFCGKEICTRTGTWWWKFVSLAPNYSQILSTTLMASTLILDGVYEKFSWRLLILSGWSAIFHLVSVSRWAFEALRVEDPSAAVAEMFDAANLQFVAMAIREKYGANRDQRTRLMGAFFVKLPTLLMKTVILAHLLDEQKQNRWQQNLVVMQAVFLTMFSISQLMPTFYVMAKKDCLYFLLFTVLLVVLCCYFSFTLWIIILLIKDAIACMSRF